MSYCTKCGKQLNGKEKFCTNCGNKLSPPYAKVHTPSAHNSKELSASVWIIALVIILLGFVFYSSNDDDCSQKSISSVTSHLKQEENGHAVSDDMKYCPLCGVDISITDIRFCPNCGKERQVTDKFWLNVVIRL